MIRALIAAMAVIAVAMVAFFTSESPDQSPIKKTTWKKNESAECRKLRGIPLSVAQRDYEDVEQDYDGTGDTAIELESGVCWIKWQCEESIPADEEGGFAVGCKAKETKFYE